jgi:nitrogen fixation NifU-like protein
LKVEDGKIADVSFEGSGCAISKSSASLMTSCLKGTPVEEAELMFDDFHRMLTESSDPADLPVKACKVAALQGVKEFPTRIKCATLIWHTMKSALHGETRASTE